MSSESSFNSDAVSKIMIGAGKKVFANVEFFKDPEFEIADIIEYNSRMRISPLEKFNGPCYISVVNLFSSLQDQESGNTLGAVILYINEDECGKLFKKLDFEDFDEDEEEEMLALSAQVVQKYTSNLVMGLRSSLGYSDLVVSEPLSYKNEVPGGVAFDYNEYKLYSASFFAWKDKRIVVELTVGPAS